MKRPIESDYRSYVAYTRALEEYCDDDDDTQVYKRPWVGLTDKEITELDLELSGRTMHECIEAIETRWREKNT